MSEALRRATVWLGELSGGLLAVVLLQEGYCFLTTGAMPMAAAAIVAVGLALVALAAASIVCAVRPGRDPFGLSPRERTLYVYATEALLVVLGVHFRLTMPELFTHHVLQRYGLFIAMGLAFGGAGLSEIFRRRKLDVLAEPLERTAALLPVLPMAAFWFVAHRPPWVWLLIAAFYGTAAVTRRIAVAGPAQRGHGQRRPVGALAAAKPGVPRPFAALADPARHGRAGGRAPGPRPAHAATVERHPLPGPVGDLLVVVGRHVPGRAGQLGDSADEPAGARRAGHFRGHGLRVRTFLYLGTTFLLVVIGALVEHLAIDRRQTWLLWVCVILLGAAIITLFAVFEKRRNDIMAALERFKQWQ